MTTWREFIQQQDAETIDLRPYASINPDEIAQTRSLAQQAGIPESAARAWPDLARQTAERADQPEIRSNSALGRFLLDPRNAAVAHDDVGNLAWWERAWNEIGSQTLALPSDAVGIGVGGTLEGVGQLYDTATVSLAEGINAISNELGFGDIAPDVTQGAMLGDTILGRPGRSLQRLGDFIGPEDRNLLGDIFGALGQMSVYLAGGLATGSARTVASMGVAQGVNIQQEQLEEAGVNPYGVEGRIATILGGGVTAVTEALQFRRLTMLLPVNARNSLRARVLDILQAGGTEAAEETIEALLQNTLTHLASEATGGEGYDIADLSILREAAAAGGAGAIARAFLQWLIPGRDRGAEVSPQEFVERLDEENQMASESRLRERDPATFEAAIDAIRPNESRLISAPAFVEHFQSAGADPFAVAEELGIGRQVLETQITTGGVVEVSAGAWARHIAGTLAYEALRPHIRPSPEQPSIAEAEAFNSEAGELLRTEAEQVREEVTANAAIRESEQRVVDNLVRAQVEAGTAETIAQTNAAPLVHLFRTYGQRLGLDSWDLYQQLAPGGLRVRSELSEAAEVGEPSEGHAEQVETELSEAPGTEVIGAPRSGSTEYNQEIVSDGTSIDIGVRRLDESVRGSIEIPTSGLGAGPLRINLGRSHNLSTFLHESGHAFLEVLRWAAAQPGAPEQIRQDWGAMRRWLGLRAGQAISTDAHEKAARGFEAYLGEGRAPSVELRPVFRRFRAWLLSIYRNLRRLNVELSDDVRSVFDRMLATDAEIAQARNLVADRRFDPAALGMNTDEAAVYERLYDEAVEGARERVLSETIRDLRRQRTDEWREERARVEEEQTARINRLPAYRALDWMANGRWPDGDPPAGLPEFRLSRDALVDTYGAEILKRLPRGKRAIYEADGLHPDLAADLFGFRSGDEMVQALLRSGTRPQAIKQATDQEVRRRLGDALTNGTIEDEALDAVNGDRRGELMMAEHRALHRVLGITDPPVSLPVLQEHARTALADRQIRHIGSPAKYLAAERIARRRQSAALAKGNRRRAYQESRKALIARAYWAEARKAEATVERVRKLSRRLGRSAARKAIGVDYVNQIDQLLERYDFRQVSARGLRKRESLLQFVQRMESEQRSVDIDQRLIDEAGRRHYGRATLEELEGLADAVRHLEHLGRTKSTLLINKKRRELGQVVGEVRDQLLASGSTRENVALVESDGQRRKRKAQDVLASILSPDTILREMDGWQDLGPVYRHLKGEIDSAVNNAWIPRQEKETERLESLWDRRYTKTERRQMRRQIPGLGYGIDKQGLLALALNQGNAYNREAVLEGNGLSQAQVDGLLRRLDEKDWRFVQDVWTYLDSFWPEIETKERERTGAAPPRVEPSPVQTPFGELTGGYYPIAFDSSRSLRVTKHEYDELIKRQMTGSVSRTQTRRGHTKERADTDGKPILLDLSIITKHVDQVLYDLTVGDSIAYSAKVLHDRRVKGAFEQTGRQGYWQALDTWLNDQAAREQLVGGWLSEFARHVRVGFTVSRLAWNVKTILLQPTGYAQSAVHLGPRYALSGVRTMISRPWAGPNSIFKEVMEKSALMRHRQQTFNKDIWATTRAMRGTRIPEGLQASFFYAIAKTQQVVDTATWLGAYHRGLDQFAGDDAKARELADRDVVRTQASGLFSDRSGVERGSTVLNQRQNEFVRAFTVLQSYMLAKGNLAYERTKRADFRSPRDIVRWTTDMIMLFVVEGVLIAGLTGAWPGDDDEDHAQAWFGLAAREGASSILGTIPIVREFASEAQGFRGGGALSAFWEAGGRVMTQARQAEFDRSLIKAVNNLGGILLHYPSAQLNRTGDAIWRAAEGEDVPLIEYMIWQERD